MIIDLDFKFFQLLVCDYDTIRILIILKSAASERLKKQLYLLAVTINSKFGDKFRAFTGVVGHIQEELQDLFNQFLFLHYSKTFEISLNKKYLNSILESGELTRMEIRLVNVIKSISKNNKLFTVKEAVDLIEEKKLASKVKWSGRLSTADVGKAIGCCDVMVLPFDAGVSFKRSSFINCIFI